MTRPAGFRTFEHTADIGLEAWGPTFAAALASVGRGLQALIVTGGRVREVERRVFDVRAQDAGALVVAWLNELLFTLDVHGRVFARFEVETKGGGDLHAVGYGEVLDPARHQLGTAVKAATYHELSVDEQDGQTLIRVILDL